MDLRLDLVCGTGEERGEALLGLGARFILGRQNQSSPWFHLPARSISRSHCEVWRDESGVWVRDLVSRNGTYVNEECIGPGPARLRPCDLLRLGPAVLRL